MLSNPNNSLSAYKYNILQLKIILFMNNSYPY